MTSIREKANAVAARGAEERGNYTPKADSVPTRLYNYWSDNAPAKKVPSLNGKTENFCHFWRVVAIWAPLRWVGNTAMDLAESRKVQVALAATFVLLLTYALVVSDNVRMVLMAVGGVALALVTLFGILLVLGTLWEKYMPERVNNWFKRNDTKISLSLVGLALLVPLTALFIQHPKGAGIAYAIIAAVGLVGYLLFPKVADYLEGKRILRKEEQRKHDDWLASLSWEDYQEYMKRYNEGKKKPPPGKISKFFKGVGDVIIFAAQVIRVKKYKICPLVTIPKN